MPVKRKFILFTVLFLVSKISYASLSVLPLKFTEILAPGQAKTVQLFIKNDGPAGDLGYSINPTPTWIKISQITGIVPLNQTVSINVVLDATTLAIGKYSAAITIGDPHHGPITIPIDLTVTTLADVTDEKNTLPKTSILHQNYPNPFNPSTQIKFELSSASNVELRVYDLTGKEIATLINGNLSSGVHTIRFDAANLSSGIYVYSLKTNNYLSLKKMILTK